MGAAQAFDASMTDDELPVQPRSMPEPCIALACISENTPASSNVNECPCLLQTSVEPRSKPLLRNLSSGSIRSVHNEDAAEEPRSFARGFGICCQRQGVSSSDRPVTPQ